MAYIIETFAINQNDNARYVGVLDFNVDTSGNLNLTAVSAADSNFGASAAISIENVVEFRVRRSTTEYPGNSSNTQSG